MRSAAARQPIKQLSQPEFIALMAMLFATIAFSVDAMLPSFPGITSELTPEAPNRVQLIITSFILGMGLGTFVTGPLSDSFGRKPVIVWGAVIYCIGAALAWAAQTLELLLFARVLQGLGAAGPRVVALAIVRDLYNGRKMAKIMSFVMMIFTLFPAFAPLLGTWIIAVTGAWRGIFGAFILFSLVSVTWMIFRQPETLPVESRRPFRPAPLLAGLIEVLSNRRVLCAIMALTLVFAAFLAVLSSTQLVFDQAFGMNDVFPIWFAVLAMIAASGSLLNAGIVERVGMRAVIKVAIFLYILISALSWGTWVIFTDSPGLLFWAYILWLQASFFAIQLLAGNLNALAMEPLGHIAGMAASIIGSVSTVAAVLLSAPISLLFNGTPMPLMLGTLLLMLVAYWLVSMIKDQPED